MSCVVGCAPLDDGSTTQPVIYGADDRVELEGHPSPELRATAAARVAALMNERRVRLVGGQVQISAEPLADAAGLCTGERFAEQPAAATCSAVLVDDDVIVTAGHCVRADEDCRGLRFVFGYRWVAGALAPIQPGDVHACREVIARRRDPPEATPRLDYAFVRLDRPVTRLAGAIRVADPIATATVTTIGHPLGLPMKIDGGGHVVDARSAEGDFFVTTADAFRGSSGSAVLDSSLALIGIQARGGMDFVDTGSCAVTAVRTATEAEEKATYATAAVDGLCQTGWPSGLCGRRAICGDGACTGGEGPTTCAEDCPAPTCGNGACEAGEVFTCDRDCALDPDEPPAPPMEADTGCDCRQTPVTPPMGVALAALWCVFRRQK